MQIVNNYRSILIVALIGSFIIIAATMLNGSSSYAQTSIAKAPGHVDAETCAGCHEQAYKAWNNSHHSWALRTPDKKNVLGDFDDASFSHKGVDSRFFKRDGLYFVETMGADGKSGDFEIKYTIGVEPLQQYLIELDKGRLQAFDVAWDTKNKRWYHVFPQQTNRPDDGLHWTGPYKNWQAQCAECHQTQFEKAYDPSTKTYASSWKELNVSCAACHGPGEAHVAWAGDPDNFSAAKYLGVDAKGLANSISSGKSGSEIKTCARCHSRREPLGANSPKPGSKFAEHYNLALLRPGLYHADGQINDEVYVYGSFLQSKMHARGVSCSNCHEPHSATLKAEDNSLCTQCHSPAGNDEFATLKKKTYDGADHHHHKSDGEGAKCVSCHMPSKNYMIVDPRRDHSFRVPRPDLSVKLGTPNACTSCHEEKSAKWAAEHVGTWYPQGRSGTPHFAELFSKARGRALDDETRNALVDLALDRQQPAIIRATSLNHLQADTDIASIKEVTPLLKADEAIIRAATVQLFRGAGEQLRLRQLLPLLDDPSKSVRIQTVRQLLNLSADSITQADRDLIAKVMKEYQSSLRARADFPQIQMALAGLAMVSRNFKAAEAAFREAVSMDPQLDQAWMTLARIQLAQSRLPAAYKTMTEALRKRPDSIPFHRMLASISLQLRQPGVAVSLLKNADRLGQNDASVKIELAGAQIQAQAFADATSSLSAALKLDPDNAIALHLTAYAYLASGNLVKAKEYTLLLRKKHPGFEINQRLMPFLEMR